LLVVVVQAGMQHQPRQTLHKAVVAAVVVVVQFVIWVRQLFPARLVLLLVAERIHLARLFRLLVEQMAAIPLARQLALVVLVALELYQAQRPVVL
jgi:hypothetical protein